MNIIAGAITPLWQRLKTTQATRLRVVRVTTDDGRRIVGVRIPQAKVGDVLRALGVIRAIIDPAEVFEAVLYNGEEIELAEGLTLKQGRIHRETVIELCGAATTCFGELRELGLSNECVSWKQRFFVPTDEEKGIPLLAELMRRYPVIVGETADSLSLNRVEEQTAEIDTISMIDLDQWLIEPAQPMATGTVQLENATEQNKNNLATEPKAYKIESNLANEPQPEPHGLNQSETTSAADQSGLMPTVQLCFNFLPESSSPAELDSGSLACAA